MTWLGAKWNPLIDMLIYSEMRQQEIMGGGVIFSEISMIVPVKFDRLHLLSVLHI